MLTIGPFGPAKTKVIEFWEQQACGEALYLDSIDKEGYRRHSAERYRLEPHIEELAQFDRWRGKQVLEVGVGLGADHQRFAEAGAVMTGVDLTRRAIDHTRRRLDLFGLTSHLTVGDGEQLDFPNNSFDMVYSYGVIHHSPIPINVISEILRVLKPGGEFRIMIYHYYSLVGFMLWLRYGIFRKSLRQVYADHLESPGTQAFKRDDAARIFKGAVDIQTHIVLTHSDLLASKSGQRHQGALLSLARLLWPRWLLKRIGKNLGLCMFVTGRKPIKAPQ